MPEHQTGETRIAIGGMGYAAIVAKTLTVRGRLALGRTADELRSVGYTPAMAREDGWTVDRHCYPWVAYVGARFDTDAFLFMHPDESANGGGE